MAVVDSCSDVSCLVNQRMQPFKYATGCAISVLVNSVYLLEIAQSVAYLQKY